MPNRIVLAEYFTTEDITLLFGVRVDWEEPKVVEIETGLQELRRFAWRYFGKQEGDKTTSTQEKLLALDSDEWQACMARFVEPILAWADPGDYVYLVPHDVLHYLPLHAVQVESRYLIERNPVLYTPSASVLKYCQAKRKPRKEWGEAALVVGDAQGNLPNARREALTIANQLNVKAYLGLEATRERVIHTLADKDQRQAIDILHFACHATFDPYQPLNSGVELADGRLTAEDIFGLEMQTALVVLSACNSGINKLRPGDELIGLTRALIYAGTPSVLVSLWEVDDVTTELLMTKFYECWIQGATKVEALQQAQQYIRGITTGNAHHPYQHLFYWAPFVLIGDWQ